MSKQTGGETTTLRDCQEPKGWQKLEHEPSETIHIKGVTVDCFRNGEGTLYERFTYPDGRIRWLKLEED